MYFYETCAMVIEDYLNGANILEDGQELLLRQEQALIDIPELSLCMASGNHLGFLSFYTESIEFIWTVYHLLK
jgi:hypothetical protein